MKKFDILEHKADLKIRAVGSDRKELFLNMLLGMTESQKPEIKNKETTKRKIKINSLDISALLVDFLSEILYQTQINKETYNNIIFDKFFDTEIGGELVGFKVERFGDDIKAVTYHQLDIHQKEDKTWEATVLFDV